MRTMAATSFLLILSAGVWFLWQDSALSAKSSDATPADQKETDEQPQGVPGFELSKLKILAGRLEALQQPLSKPQKGDWLETHPEEGQTFARFLETHPAPAPRHLTAFYIQPIGTFTKTQNKLIAETAKGLKHFYGREVKLLPVVPLADIPAQARRINQDTKQTQILTSYVLDDLLKPHRPKDSIAVLALSAEDLWPGKGWNFVFGQASLSERVGVWSIARFGNPDESPKAYQLCLERMLGTALHESGHMMGIQHCTAWNCCMNGSNNLPESDRHPLWFCAECQPKVWWACRLNPRQQLEAMAKYAAELKLTSAAKHWADAERAIENP